MSVTLLLDTLRRRWYWLLIGACIAGAAAGVWTRATPPVFVATVDLVPTRAAAGAPLSAGVPVWFVGATPERRQALAQLVRNPDVERAVQAELGERLPQALREPGGLMTLVRGRTALRSEVVSVVVEAPEPSLSRVIAPVWARAFARKVNEVYGASEIGVMSDVPLVEVRGSDVLAWVFRGAILGGLAGSLAALVVPIRGHKTA